jgi:prepilin-type N-terminal cleavage/methylation domain-containing protein
MQRHAVRGFTLLELSIVLVIVAIVTGLSLEMGISVIATSRLTATQQKALGSIASYIRSSALRWSTCREQPSRVRRTSNV